jgi:hypothetical protein
MEAVARERLTRRSDGRSVNALERLRKLRVIVGRRRSPPEGIGHFRADALCSFSK